jgi:hypothetical protein
MHKQPRTYTQHRDQAIAQAKAQAHAQAQAQAQAEARAQAYAQAQQAAAAAAAARAAAAAAARPLPVVSQHKSPAVQRGGPMSGQNRGAVAAPPPGGAQRAKKGFFPWPSTKFIYRDTMRIRFHVGGV